MTLAAAILQAVGQFLAIVFFAFMVLFIAAVCIMAWLCSFFRASSNGYALRYRDLAGRVKQERKRTLLITPDHQDPHIVGDVPHFHQAQYPASRANVRRGEG